MTSCENCELPKPPHEQLITEQPWSAAYTIASYPFTITFEPGEQLTGRNLVLKPTPAMPVTLSTSAFDIPATKLPCNGTEP